MNTTIVRSMPGFRAFLGTMVALGALVAAPMRLRSETASTPTVAVVEAAKTFLSSLDEAQRAKEIFAYNDQKQRARWSNLPVSFVPRAGLALGELSKAQRAAAMALLASALSPQGFQKIEQIMEGDEMLKIRAGNSGPSSGSGSPIFGKDLYYISILGQPSAKDPWMVQFGGHHLALNLTFVGPEGVLTPSLTGAQPAIFQENGRTIRPLGPESDKAFDLLNSLDEGQRAHAVLKYKVADLVLGPGHDGETIEPEGLPASAMNEGQRAMLLDLIAQWVGIARDEYARPRMDEIRAGIENTWFAWSGPTTHAAGRNGTAYYRVQGPKLVIEFAPQSLGGDRTMHVHTMYRDPTNDYARAGAVK